MAYRVTSKAAAGGRQQSRLCARSGGPPSHSGRRAQAHAERSDRALTHNVIAWGVVLSCLTLASASILLLGRAHDAGSVRTYTASHKSLKIALVEPDQQAQMEAPTAVALAVPSGPDVRVKTAALDESQRVQLEPAAPLRSVPLPRVKPRQLVAAARLQRERAAEKAPELSAPVTIAALDTTSETTTVGTPSPQPSPTSDLPNSGKPEFGRGEGEGLEVTATPEVETAAVAAVTDTAEKVAPETKIADTAPVPATFGPARPTSSFQLTSYAPTREQVFGSEVTGSIDNPWRELETKAAPAVETTKSLTRGVVPSPRPAPQEGAETHAVPGSTKLETPKPAAKLAKPRKLTPQEKLWGPTVRLASLTPMDNVRDSGNPGGIPRAPYDRQTAVYVITDKKVYLPDGTVLEAHSGLGSKMDDPRHVRVRMHGATPPHVYDLKMREALFHGVEAIRMLPIGGSDEIFGRDGILAHTYMLGPNGQSNGCVSIKDYDTFLEAFKDGKINRIAVLATLD